MSNPESLNDFTKQDSIILNIQRASEGCIDLAMHIVAEKRLGLPQSSREAFDMLQANSIIEAGIATKMKAMVGFRNIAIRDYQTINLDILEQLATNHLDDFTLFTEQVLKY